MGSILAEPLLTERTGKESARGGDRSSMLREMRDKRKEVKQAVGGISGQEVSLSEEPDLK